MLTKEKHEEENWFNGKPKATAKTDWIDLKSVEPHINASATRNNTGKSSLCTWSLREGASVMLPVFFFFTLRLRVLA